VASRALSVVVPHYGDPAPALALLAALERQRGDLAALQLIVSDDASPSPFPEAEGVEVVRRPSNGGFGSAVNSGAARAEHPLLLVLNSDLEIGPTFLTDLLTASEPWMPACVSPRVVGPDGATSWPGRHFPTVGHQVVEWLTPLARWRPRLHEAVGHDTATEPSRTSVVDWVVGAAMLLPTDELRAVGGFDERFFMNAEEVDLQRRLRDRGLRSVVLAEPVVVHEGGGSSDPERRRRWLVDSRLAYADKWGGRRRLQAALVAATGANLVWNTGRRLLGRRVEPLRTARTELDLIFGKVDP
jgi:N-acetylglucosaminyl-diphospho-decaprenol L-rhamnosyltransferase